MNASIGQSAHSLNPGAAQAPVASGQRVPTRVVAATVAGNALEFYDFVTYAFFAVYIGKAFFPASTPMGSLLLSVAVFGVGFFARPLGGVLIGAYADRAGRRPAMLLTIGLITVGTLGLALTPSYASIGIAAPVIVVICRLVQGLALGGEVGPASAFLIEAAPPKQRGLYASWQLASQGGAACVAGLVGMAMNGLLTPQDMAAWGWRVPFLVGLLLVPLAIYLRRSMPETLHAAPVRMENRGKAGLVKHRGLIALAVLLVLGGTVSTYVINFMTTYAITTLKMSPGVALSATVVGGFVSMLCALLGGWLSDRFSRKATMLWPRVLAALIVVPAFLLLVAYPGIGMLMGVAALLSALTAIAGAASFVAIPELLPRGIRATGMSIAYAVGVSIFGGTTQFVITWLIATTGNPAAPAWYMAAASVIAIVAMLALPESRNRALED
ncbi:MFS transporter [Variovorax sp. ZT5P49]|uniref:MFS transporter n=1 Tax=Variovorax sp. ZT5P49 TaxID=3443733 RepID=UPI003F477DDE